MTHPHNEPRDHDGRSEGADASLASTVEAVLNEGERAPRTVLDAVRYIGIRVVVIGAAAMGVSILMNALMQGEFRISWVGVIGAMVICSALTYGQMRRHQRAEADLRETLGLR